MKPAETKRNIFVYAGEYSFPGVGAIFTGEAARLEINPIPVENRIELVEGKTRGASGTDEKQIAFREARLNGCHIQRLKQLRLEKLTDPGNLVAR